MTLEHPYANRDKYNSGELLPASTTAQDDGKVLV